MKIRDMKPDYPRLNDLVIHKSYPNINRNYWYAWLDNFVWNKEVKTITITESALDKISIPRHSLDNYSPDRTFIVQSYDTDRWYPFSYWKTFSGYIYFSRVDENCPVKALIIELGK